MNDTIRRRKSIRKYKPGPLDASTMKEVEAHIMTIRPLYPEIKFSLEIINKAKRSFGINAPHYLILRSEEKEGAFENIGFIGQQMDLFFSESGIGSCWVGMARPGEECLSKLPYVICIAFGKPDEPVHRMSISEFKRKPLSEISEGTDVRLESARLAPSGMNSQNWYFVAENGKIHCYRKKTGIILKSMMDKMSCIDMGIALYHIKRESNDFVFEKEIGIPDKKGYIYVGTVGIL